MSQDGHPEVEKEKQVEIKKDRESHDQVEWISSSCKIQTASLNKIITVDFRFNTTTQTSW